MTRHSESIDLFAIAHQTMIEEGFEPDFPAPVATEVRSMVAESATITSSTGDEDLRDLLWSSIDDKKTRDLDQVEYAEITSGGDTRLLVGIADVDAFVSQGSVTDKHAGTNCTSVYTGVKTFPMLPEELSTDLTSLMENEDRLAVVTELILAADGSVKKTNFYRALLKNHAKLSYEAVGAWLDGKTGVPESVSNVPGMEAQIKLQSEIAERFEKYRKEHGALNLETIQAKPEVDEQGRVVGLAVVESNSARELIANFMISANVAMAEFLEAKGGPSLRRIVRTPKYWDRIVEIADEVGEKLPANPDSRALSDFLSRRKVADPVHFPDLSLAVVKSLGPGEYAVQLPGEEGEGHFGLAVQDYTHSTAPNRRFADLVTQRLVKAALANDHDTTRTPTAPKSTPDGPPSRVSTSGAPTSAPGSTSMPYDVGQLKQIAEHCTIQDSAARKVERKMRKVAAALLLHDKIGEEFNAIVTGVTPKGTFARVINPPVDGRVVRGEHKLRVGEKVRVRLLSTDPERGFIDFARL
ncbi:MAG TPA: RNB domain-containing ribonuclease [Pyrinomonadaceae bacterium]